MKRCIPFHLLAGFALKVRKLETAKNRLKNKPPKIKFGESKPKPDHVVVSRHCVSTRLVFKFKKHIYLNVLIVEFLPGENRAEPDTEYI